MKSKYGKKYIIRGIMCTIIAMTFFVKNVSAEESTQNIQQETVAVSEDENVVDGEMIDIDSTNTEFTEPITNLPERNDVSQNENSIYEDMSNEYDEEKYDQSTNVDTNDEISEEILLQDYENEKEETVEEEQIPLYDAIEQKYTVSSKEELFSALDDVEYHGGTILLDADMSCSDSVSIYGKEEVPITINTNGYTLSIPEDKYIWMEANINLVGDGTIKGRIFARDKCKLTLDGVTVNGGISSSRNAVIYIKSGKVVSDDILGAVDLNDASLVMNGGEIENAGIEASGTSNIDISGGIITGGVSAGGGANGEIWKTSITMTGGTIIGHSSMGKKSSGIEMNMEGEINISGGTIKECDNGIFLHGGKCTLTGGQIKENGCGVCQYSGELFMEGGIIESNGCGYKLASGTATISEGTIKSNTDCGLKLVKLHNENTGKTTIGTLKIAGNPVIFGNKDKNGIAKDITWIYTPEKPQIIVNGVLKKGCKIGIFPYIDSDYTTGYRTYNGSSNPTNYFISNDTNYIVMQNSTTGELLIKKKPEEKTSQKITKVMPKSKTIISGQKYQIKVYGQNLKGTEKYSVKNKKVAAVAYGGFVTGKAKGTTDIQVYVDKKANYTKSNTAKCKVTVKNPSKVILKKVSAGRRSFTAKWKKTTCSGYIIEYSLSRDFKKSRKVLAVRGGSKTSGTVNNLKKGKTYFIRVYAYGYNKNIKSVTSNIKQITCK